jgi:hypothetical protein
MSSTPSRRRRRVVVLLTAAFAALASPTAASAAASETTVFFEETAEAFWSVPHTCADGTVVQGTLLVRSTRDFGTPETGDADPTVRVQFQAVCPGGSSYTWGGIIPATITSTENLKSLTATASGSVRDIFGVTHQVTFDVTWTGVGPLETSVSTNASPGFSVNTSTRKQRAATAEGTVTFDGAVLVDGPAEHPTRPDPFIRTDEERTTRPPA